MFREMEEAGQPAPEYRQNEFMVYATIRQAKDAVTMEKTTKRDEGVNGGVNGEVLSEFHQQLDEGDELSV